MKRIIPALCALIILLAAAGCGGGGASGYTADDLYLAIGGEQYRCREDITAVIARLGETYEYAEGRSCDYDGLDKTYLYDAAEFYTWPLAEGDIVNEIYTESTEAATSRGIKVGASKAEVLAAYGEGGEDTGWQLIYRLADSPSLAFDLEGDVVTAICLTLQPL